MRRFRSSARAKHISCRCPTLKLLPPSDTNPPSPLQSVDHFAEVRVLQCPPHRVVAVLIEGVDVEPNRPRKEHRVLRDHGHGRAEPVEAHRRRGDAVQQYLSAAGLHQAEEGQEDAALAGPRTTTDPDLFAVAEGEGQAVEHEGQALAVPHAQVPHLHSTCAGPNALLALHPQLLTVRGHRDAGGLERSHPVAEGLEVVRRFLRQFVSVLEHALHGIHLGLRQSGHGSPVIQKQGDVQRIDEDDADEPGADAAAGGQDGGEKDDGQPQCV